eukprot:jgi/Psemu1/7697/gm1.7697_g
MLYKDMKNGIVPLEPEGFALKELYWYLMQPEYAEYAAEEDKSAFDLYIKIIQYCIATTKAMLNGKTLNPNEENSLMTV